MANTYSWKILRIDNYPRLVDENGVEFLDVIYAVQWQITGTDDAGNAAWIYDSMGINIDLTQAYTPRNQITQDQIISWVQSELGPDKISSLEAQIDQMLIDLAAQKG